MENSAIPLPQQRTALPTRSRPLSMLPTPRSIQQSAIPAPSFAEPSAASNHRTQTSVGSSSASSNGSISPSRTQPPHNRPYASSSLQRPQRQPLYPVQRPQSKQSNDTSSTGSVAYNEDAFAALTGARTLSQQENAPELPDSPDGSDGSTSNSASPVRTLKRPPRPSLSDRTVESLAYMSPAANRRSSFFNPDSPMPSPNKPTPSRPTQLGTRPVQRATTYPRPASPLKRPNSRTAQIATPSQRPVPSALPRSGLPSVSTPSTQSRIKAARPTSVYGGPPAGSAATPVLATRAMPRATTSAARRPQSVYGGVPLNRPTPGVTSPTKPPAQAQVSAAISSRKPGSRLSMIGVPKPQMQPANSSRPMAATSHNPLAKSIVKPIAKPKTDLIATTPTGPAVMDKQIESPVEKPANSSASLRTQIAQAKAAHKKAAANPSSDYNFETCADPFNTGASRETSTLANRIDSARRDGRLNIAALELKELPLEVLNMYDAEAMESSSVPWSEIVDLTRLNAADNMIRSIPDKAFRDVSIADLAAAEDERGNQFGGLELLDLHGNQLTRMPMGLRRLERLTVLNLSRNKLDYKIFEVVVQISALRELRLGDNDLAAKVPDEIGQLTNLEILDLQNNKFATFPRSIRDLEKLRVLNLSKNRFADLPLGSIFSLPDLQELYVGTNALTGAFFSENVDTIRKLQTLDISNNSLAALSFSPELHLPALQYISVSSNRLFAFPDVSRWPNLLTLLAEENGLSELPPGFTALKKLKNADFSRNSLRLVENEVAKMDALDTFNIASNPLRDKRLLNMNTREIKDDLLKRLETADALK